MGTPRLCSVLLAIVALASPALPADAQPVGDEFQVNTHTTSSQRTGRLSRSAPDRSVAADANGNFVVVWTSDRGGASEDDVFAQRFDSAGAPLGAEFLVNSRTTLDQHLASVASDAAGNFVVVWKGRDLSGTDWDIFGQRYDSAGSPLGGEFRVNTYTATIQVDPAVASDATGNFVVVWQSAGQDYGSGNGVFGQRYDSAGLPLGSEFLVNTYVQTHQDAPSVAADTNGNFVVVWANQGRGGNPDNGIFGQRYDSAGTQLGGEFQVNTYTPGFQVSPSIASDASGDFVVVWESGQGQDGDARGIFGQRYDSAGNPLGSEFQVNSYATGGQYNPSVSADASGNLVVTWDNSNFGDQDGSGSGVFGQRYDSTGAAQGDEFQINAFTTGDQQVASVQATGPNTFVVAWESYGQDGDDFGVFAKRLAFDGAESITVVSPNTNVKWRVGSPQKIQWTHTIGANASFRIELDRDDDGDFEELIAAHAHATNATRGSFTWTVTGPPSGTARVRVSLTGDPGVSDASDVTFQIRPAGLSATEDPLGR